MREKKEINIYIGKQVKKLRENAGLTQDQFGELLSLGPKNISDIERGVAGITILTLKRICDKLSISSDAIIFENRNCNDVEYISNRLKHLPPEQFKIIKTFLDQTLDLFSQMEHKK